MFRNAGRVGTTLVHLCLDPLVGAVGFALVVTGLSITASLAITVVGGAAVLAAMLWLLGRYAWFERARANALLDAGIDQPPPDRRVVRFGWFGRQLTSTERWRAVAYAFLHPIVGTVLFAVTLAVWCTGLVGTTLPIYIAALPSDTARLGLIDLHGMRDATLAAAAGLAVLIAAPFVTLAAGRVDLALVRGLLGRDREAELRAEVQRVSARRDAAVDAAEAERRRIERDLHDGAQQRLVALGMTLGMAREKLDADPERARALLDEAHADAKAAMTELRAIARGIHPAVLDDRGLDAALSALAARSPVPVTVSVRLPGRMGLTVEGAAYYVVAEALTNVAKHARASHATVDVSVRSDVVVVEVRDDGRGGASIENDGGLAGLRDRVAALGGSLRIVSPASGRTVVTAEIPHGR